MGVGEGISQMGAPQLVAGSQGLGSMLAMVELTGAGEVTSGSAVHRWSLLRTCGFASWQLQRHTIL